MIALSRALWLMFVWFGAFYLIVEREYSPWLTLGAWIPTALVVLIREESYSYMISNCKENDSGQHS